MTTELTAVTPARFVARPRSDVLASYEYVLGNLSSPGVRILDVRSQEEFRAERVRARRGGAIPTALNREWTCFLDPRGHFKPAEALKADFAALNLSPDSEIITYCQGGYRAAHTWLALRLAGYPRVRNYLGSWAEWGNREDSPIEVPGIRTSPR